MCVCADLAICKKYWIDFPNEIALHSSLWLQNSGGILQIFHRIIEQ